MAQYNPKPSNKMPILYFDGGSRGNPGEAAGAAVIVMPDGKQLSVSKYIKIATNNEAEYTGLVIGLQRALELGIQELSVKGDSQLVINQVNGKWKVNSPNLKQFYDDAKRLMESFDKIKIDWVRRNENHLADAVVNQCIDRGETVQTALKSESKSQKVELNVSQLDKLIKLGKKANLKDYSNLKSGRDEFTSLGLSELKKRVAEDRQQEIEKAWDGTDKYLAKVYRWYLRGLPPEMAIRKVEIDAEVEAKLTGKHPWLEELNDVPKSEDLHKNNKIIPYAKGDIIVISQPDNSLLKHQGVIVSEPNLSQEGNWIITIKIQEGLSQMNTVGAVPPCLP